VRSIAMPVARLTAILGADLDLFLSSR